MTSRLKSIDCLRGTAALAVVLAHALTYIQTPPHGLDFITELALPTVLGGFGVPLFFVISGFCIHAKCARNWTEGNTAPIDMAAFWRRRFWRLYPPYFVALTLCMALVLLADITRREVPLVNLYPAPKLLWMGVDYVLHSLMLHGLHPIFDRAGGNPPFWTLAREEYLYLLYFPLLAWRTRWGVVWSTAITLALGMGFHTWAVIAIPASSPWLQLASSSAVTLWFQWSLGTIAVEAYAGLIPLPRWCKAPALIPVWGLLAYKSYQAAPLLAPVLWGLACFTLVNACVHLESNGRWQSHSLTALVTKVGLFSYSLYLVHNPVRAVMKQLLGALLPGSTQWGYLAMVVLIVVAGLAAGLGFFHLIERHFLIPRDGRQRE